jgi:threonine dehydrogenase-like Zn-dependent dehydrogenase
VGVIEKLGSAVEGYAEGQRVIAGAITPSGHSYASLDGFRKKGRTRDSLSPSALEIVISDAIFNSLAPRVAACAEAL